MVRVQAIGQKKCIMVGYSQHGLGYRLYNPATKKFTVQKHVTFNKEGAWQWSNDGTKAQEPDPTLFTDPFPAHTYDIEADLSPHSPQSNSPHHSQNDTPSTSQPPFATNIPSTSQTPPAPDPYLMYHPVHQEEPVGHPPGSKTTLPVKT
ncbi:hypothetical protein E3N88_33202 [Mikania micrantha]|uniref:Retroviral polymerase SH3-like domain-containing protein n=1 Tax=Mikania micrantha TaxID=192012 RepID=A0A5N6MB56_9ASTR|nr:hypothetical protein E3N88_33202 [Mikania micrantha]